MAIKDILVKELVRNGYSEDSGVKRWNLANRSLLNATPELSKGFLQMMDFNVYRRAIFERELNLIKDSVPEFMAKIGDEPFNLIDLGCGNGEKAKEFIKNMGNIKVRYCAISSSDHLAGLAAENISKENFSNVSDVISHIGHYDKVDGILSKMRNSNFQRNVILLHGSILASYEINDFLFNLSNAMLPGDFIIIGNAIRTGEDRLTNIEVYKDEAFHRWFMHVMKELGFKEDEIEYDAMFGNSRIESFYRLKKDKELKSDEENIFLKAGDEVMVFFLYKYYQEELEKFLKMYFKEVSISKDSENEYILALCSK